jgi:hypothetical protein
MVPIVPRCAEIVFLHSLHANHNLGIFASPFLVGAYIGKAQQGKRTSQKADTGLKRHLLP